MTTITAALAALQASVDRIERAVTPPLSREETIARDMCEAAQIGPHTKPWARHEMIWALHDAGIPTAVIAKYVGRGKRAVQVVIGKGRST